VAEGTVVQLEECELQMALSVGCWRRLRVLRERLGSGHGEKEHGAWDRHLVGAIAELAVAKLLNRYWGGAPADFGKAGDVAGYEVRATTHEHGHLVVYLSDPQDRPLVLVVVGARAARVVGYLPAGTGREDRYLAPAAKLRPGSPMQWWVPQAALTPFRRRRMEQTA
jgi:hypothetical protein